MHSTCNAALLSLKPALWLTIAGQGLPVLQDLACRQQAHGRDQTLLRPIAAHYSRS